MFGLLIGVQDQNRIANWQQPKPRVGRGWTVPERPPCSSHALQIPAVEPVAWPEGAKGQAKQASPYAVSVGYRPLIDTQLIEQEKKEK